MQRSTLSDDHISTLCDVARSAGIDVSADRKACLTDLVSGGYVAKDEKSPSARYKLTPAGQAVLDARGVGANES